MPMSWPRPSSSAPPEFPGLIGASVWIMPVAEGDPDLVGARYDVRIGEDVALVVDHDPGTLSLAERPRAGTVAGGIDRDYAVLGLLIDGGIGTGRRDRCRHPGDVGRR